MNYILLNVKNGGKYQIIIGNNAPYVLLMLLQLVDFIQESQKKVQKYISLIKQLRLVKKYKVKLNKK